MMECWYYVVLSLCGTVSLGYSHCVWYCYGSDGGMQRVWWWVGGVVVGGMLSESREREGEAGYRLLNNFTACQSNIIRRGMHDIHLKIVRGKTCF